MTLTRKRKRELGKLKGNANDVWQDQMDVLNEAQKVLKEASRQAANYSREEVAPRVREAYEERVAPVVEGGVAATKRAASVTKDVFVDGVLPAVSAAVGSVIAAVDVSRDPHVRDALKRVRSASREVSTRARRFAGKVELTPPPKNTPGAGFYLLIGVGVVAAAAIGYAVWQTLRADDDLWIDDEPETTVS
jgi:hypothetical protein